MAICFAPESSNVFFRSLFIFTGGLVCDYWSLIIEAQKEGYKYQKGVGVSGVVFNLLGFVFSVLGLIGVLSLDLTQTHILVMTNANFKLFKSFRLNFQWVLYCLGVFPILAGLEGV